MWKFLVVFLSAISTSFESSYARQLESYRLPNNTTPESYYINLEFNDFDGVNTDFVGNILVVIKVHEDTSVIALHCTVLVSKVNLTKIVNGIEIEVAQTYDVDTRRQFLLVETTEEIIKKDTKLWLGIDFMGKISTGVEEGIFMKSYDKNYYVATHAQPNFARRIFPCYDEPSFKSKFRLTLFHNKKYKALSSLGEGRSIDHPTIPQKRITIFDQSKYFMSSYHIAFVISEFEALESTTENGISLRIFAKLEQQQLLTEENAIFALETTERVLKLFGELFEIPFQFGTLDQVALPHSHHCGDYGSYGIAFYSENCLLSGENVTSANDLERTVLAITNNVCHQFLGNLITPSWWSTSLWISEGLCRFYEHLMGFKVHPTIIVEGLFAATTMESALSADLSSSHSMSYYEESPSALRELFDVIALNKSASLFRMFYHSFSALAFTEGLKIYLSEAALNPMGVTESQQLYDAWQHAVDSYNNGSVYKVAELFGSWEQQEGYPILYVERSYNDHLVRFTQNRFTESIKDGKLHDSLWHIPITYTFKHSQTDQLNTKFWLSKARQMEIEIEDLRPHSFFLVNVNRVGYYRVQYDDANWMLIANELSHGNPNISPISHAMLINDAGKFYMNGILNVRIFLQLTRHLQNSVDYTPWLAATSNMEYMRRMLDNDDELSNDFKTFLRVLFSNLFSNFAVHDHPNEPNYHKHIRNIAIEWSCKVHFEPCLKSTQDKMRQFKDEGVISVDHENAILCHGLIRATTDDFEFMWHLHESTLDPERRMFYLKVIGCIESKEILMEFMERIFESKHEWKDILRAGYSNNRIGLRVTLEFLLKNYDRFIGLLLELKVKSSLNELFLEIATHVNDDSTSSILSDLLNIYNVDLITREEVHSIVYDNQLWLDTHTNNIRIFLNDFHNASASLAFKAISYLVIIFGLASNWIMSLMLTENIEYS